MSARLATVLTTTLIVVAFTKPSTSTSFNNGFIRQPSACVDIPADLKLCHRVGYYRMVLPNLLRHETLDEVKQQASSFVPLLRQHCHPHLQIFLCSLFAPVCLDQSDSAFQGPIPPCQSLCRDVERSCTPIMAEHTFSWPKMLNCSQFSNRDPCVSLENETVTVPPPTVANSGVCAPCRTPLATETVLDNFCASEFVLKIKSKRIREDQSRGLREITAEKRRRIVYKQGPLENSDLKRLKLMVKGGAGCACPQLDEQGATARKGKKRKGKKRKNKRQRKVFYLIMGRKVGRELLVTVLHRWEKRNTVLRKLGKNKFADRSCPTFGIPMSGRRRR